MLNVVTMVRAGIACLVYEVTGLRAGRSRNRNSIPGRAKLFISSPKLPTSVFGTTQPSIKWGPVAADRVPLLMLRLRKCGVQCSTCSHSVPRENFTFTYSVTSLLLFLIILPPPLTPPPRTCRVMLVFLNSHYSISEWECNLEISLTFS